MLTFSTQSLGLKNHDRAEVLDRAKAECDVDHQKHAGRTVRPHTDEKTPTAVQVAGVVAGIPTIGMACEALLRAGWRASIAVDKPIIPMTDRFLDRHKHKRVHHRIVGVTKARREAEARSLHLRPRCRPQIGRKMGGLSWPT